MVSQLCLGSGNSQPYDVASFIPSPRSAAWCMSFLGMHLRQRRVKVGLRVGRRLGIRRLRSVAAHPTLTQVPPRPQVVPCGVGLTKSQTATFLPYLAAALEQARPPEPPPITCARRGARSGALAVPGPLMPTGANGMRALTFSGAGLAAGARAVRVARTVAARAAEHRCGRTG